MDTNWKRSIFGIVTLSVVLAGNRADAQDSRFSFSPGIAGGFSETAGSIGYYGLGTFELTLPVKSVRLRGDALFADWGAGRVTSLTANVLVSPFRSRKVVPYGIAGAGAYAQNATGSIDKGWTLGLGLKLPGKSQSIFVESRLHTFVGQRRELLPPNEGKGWRALWVPLGIGIQF